MVVALEPAAVVGDAGCCWDVRWLNMSNNFCLTAWIAYMRRVQMMH